MNASVFVRHKAVTGVPQPWGARVGTAASPLGAEHSKSLDSALHKRVADTGSASWQSLCGGQWKASDTREQCKDSYTAASTPRRSRDYRRI